VGRKITGLENGGVLLCETLDFLSGIVDALAFLRCYAALVDSQVQTFWKGLTVLFSRTLKMGGKDFPEKYVGRYQLNLLTSQKSIDHKYLLTLALHLVTCFFFEENSHFTGSLDNLKKILSNNFSYFYPLLTNTL
jgi:hypothetical protein